MGKLIRAAKPAVERVPPLASAYRGARSYYSLLRRFYRESQPAPTVTTLHGFRFAAADNGSQAMAAGTFEPAETELFLSLLPAADLVVNVGANVGYYCCLALQSGKSVMAFEPLQFNLHFLYQNIHQNGWSDRCEIYPVALGNTTGLLELYGTGTGASLIPGWASQPTIAPALVPIFPFDQLIGQRTVGRRCIALVDVEGAEFQFLQGAESLLHQDPKPIWMVEITSRQHQPAGVEINPRLLDTFRLFWQAGYQSYVADATLTEMDEEKVIANANLSDVTQQKYNFLFVEHGALPRWLPSGTPTSPGTNQSVNLS